MTSLKLKTLLASLALAASGLASAQNTLLNVSYDVAREFYKDYNAAFAAHYKKTTGQDVKIDQSHAGSSAQARAVNDGLAADVVTMNTTTDVQFLADNGVVAKDWTKKFPHDASPTTSTMLFLVRNGNPKGIKDWEDLIKPGVQVIVVNPKTGGNGRYAYLAAWGAIREKGGTEAQAAEFVSKLYKNVPVLAKAYLDYLYSDEAQEIAAKHAIRPRSEAVLKKYAATFKPLKQFTVAKYFGSLTEAQKVHFNDGGQFDKLYTPGAK